VRLAAQRGDGLLYEVAAVSARPPALVDYAAAHLEIATYRALIDASRHIGEDEVAGKLEQILRQEQDMAQFLEDKLPGAVQQALVTAD
jgi:ferritin-like metal-binding protein YciE